MGRCSFDKLTDLQPVFDKVVEWPAIKSPKPGIFYMKSQGFMHFHEKEGKIWADIRSGDDWGAPVDIPAKITKTFLNKFLKEIQKRYKSSGGEL